MTRTKKFRPGQSWNEEEVRVLVSMCEKLTRMDTNVARNPAFAGVYRKALLMRDRVDDAHANDAFKELAPDALTLELVRPAGYFGSGE